MSLNSNFAEQMFRHFNTITFFTEKQSLSELKDEWAEFAKHIRADDGINPVETFLKLKVSFLLDDMFYKLHNILRVGRLLNKTLVVD